MSSAHPHMTAKVRAHSASLSAAARSSSASHCKVVAQEAKQRRKKARSAQVAQSSIELLSSSFIRVPVIFGSRPAAKPRKGFSPSQLAWAKRFGRLPKATVPIAFSTVMGITTMGTTFTDLNSKPADNTGNHRSTAEGFDLQLLTPSQLEAFSHSKAFTEALRHDPRTDVQIARQANVSKGHLSKLRTGLWEEQAARLKSILFEVGHAGPVQKLVFDLGFELKRRKPRGKPKGAKS